MVRKHTPLGFLLFLAILLPSFAAEPAEDAEFRPRLSEFLPPPPEPESDDFRRDVAAYQSGMRQRSGKGWEQAAVDADIRTADLFLPVFGIRISRKETPATRKLLRSAGRYIEKSIGEAKEHYGRTRPFEYFGDFGATCTPKDETRFIGSNSYPSSHAARGWGLALILAELSPERQGAILKRGYEFGQSRVICGVHWQSDVDASRLAASACVIQLHNDPDFMKKLKEAKKEIELIRRSQNAPTN